MIDLPVSTTARWTPKRKAAVVLAIKLNEISKEEAGRIYGFSPEEIKEWIDKADNHGYAGLKATKHA